MDFTRDLAVSAPVALILTVLFFYAFSTSTTTQFPNIQTPLPTTARGFPLQFQYVYRPANCPVNVQVTYCLPPAPTQTNWINAGLDYIFWFAVSLLFVCLFDFGFSKRHSDEEKQAAISTLSPETGDGVDQ